MQRNIQPPLLRVRRCHSGATPMGARVLQTHRQNSCRRGQVSSIHNAYQFWIRSCGAAKIMLRKICHRSLESAILNLRFLVLIYRRDFLKFTRVPPRTFLYEFWISPTHFYCLIWCHKHFWQDLVDLLQLLMKMSLIFLATGIKESLVKLNFAFSSSLLCIVILDFMFFETDTCQSSPIIANMITNIAQILRLRPWHFSTWGLADDTIVVTLEVAVLGFPSSDQ